MHDSLLSVDVYGAVLRIFRERLSLPFFDYGLYLSTQRKENTPFKSERLQIAFPVGICRGASRVGIDPSRRIWLGSDAARGSVLLFAVWK